MLNAFPNLLFLRQHFGTCIVYIQLCASSLPSCLCWCIATLLGTTASVGMCIVLHGDVHHHHKNNDKTYIAHAAQCPSEKILKKKKKKRNPLNRKLQWMKQLIKPLTLTPTTHLRQSAVLWFRDSGFRSLRAGFHALWNYVKWKAALKTFENLWYVFGKCCAAMRGVHNFK